MPEYEEILSWHPQLILISKKPAIWRGFLKINNNRQVEIKLRVPNYPKVNNLSIKFGNNINLFRGSSLSKKVYFLKKKATSVLSFLNQLQKTMSDILKENISQGNRNVNFYAIKHVEELKDIVLAPGVTVFVDKNFDIIKLTYNNISIQLRRDSTGINPWKVISSDMPQIREWKSLEECVPTLTEAVENFKIRVNALENTWENLKIIDENCWVVDPIIPKPCHLYRRIFLSPLLSIFITLNPLDPESLPEIKLLGSDEEVAKCQNTMNENLNKWSNDNTIFENILNIMNISEFPRAPKTKEHEGHTNNGIVSDEECCICFSVESDDGFMPSEVCDNKKCRKNFHTLCLYQWLSAVVGNQTVFDRIHGTCPNCNESISCQVVSNS